MPIGETLPSPPQYERNLPPGQRRLGAEPMSGPSRVVGFQPITRTISAQAEGATTSYSVRSALTSARPPEVKSATTLKELHPPMDVNDDFKYLHMGDRKMKVVITRGVGKPVGQFGKDRRGKPRSVLVDSVGGRVEGFVEVGKVDACIGLDMTVSFLAGLGTVLTPCRSRQNPFALNTIMDTLHFSTVDVYSNIASNYSAPSPCPVPKARAKWSNRQSRTTRLLPLGLISRNIACLEKRRTDLYRMTKRTNVQRRNQWRNHHP